MSRNEYRAPNPKDLTTFQYIRLQRATDLVFTTPVNVELKLADTSNEATTFIDTGGTTSSYYRHRGSNLAETLFTDWSDPILFGDYWVRQQVKHDIPDADIVNGDWDTWRDQTFIDMQSFGLGRPADVQDFAPGSDTDYFANIRGDIRRVDRVEIWRTVPSVYWTWITAWEQRGRKLRVYRPKTSYTYKIYGTAELRDLNDLDDELWNILYWGMRWRYLLFRGQERVDMRPFLSRTRQTDTTTQTDFKRLADDAKLQFDQAIARSLEMAGLPAGATT